MLNHYLSSANRRKECNFAALGRFERRKDPGADFVISARNHQLSTTLQASGFGGGRRQPTKSVLTWVSPPRTASPAAAPVTQHGIGVEEFLGISRMASEVPKGKLVSRRTMTVSPMGNRLLYAGEGFGRGKMSSAFAYFPPFFLCRLCHSASSGRYWVYARVLMDNKIQSLGKLFFLRSFSAHVLQRGPATKSELGKIPRHYEECLRFFAERRPAERRKPPFFLTSEYWNVSSCFPRFHLKLKSE